MRNLTYLTLWGNSIERLDHLAFRGLDKLKTMEIKYNRIHTFGTWALYGLDGLVELKIFNNTIGVVEEGGFHLSDNSTKLTEYNNTIVLKHPRALLAPSGLKIEGKFDYLENIQLRFFFIFNNILFHNPDDCYCKSVLCCGYLRNSTKILGFHYLRHHRTRIVQIRLLFLDLEIPTLPPKIENFPNGQVKPTESSSGECGDLHT